MLTSQMLEGIRLQIAEVVHSWWVMMDMHIVKNIFSL